MPLSRDAKGRGRRVSVAGENRKYGSTVIYPQILVERYSQKAIIPGARGSMIKAIGETGPGGAISEMTRRKVHLFLHVKVTADWADDRAVFRDIGLNWVE